VVPVGPPDPDGAGLGLDGRGGAAGLCGAVTPALGAGVVGAGVVGAGAAVGINGGGALAVTGTVAGRGGLGLGLGASFIAGSVPTGATLTIPTALAGEPAAGLAGAPWATAGVPWLLSNRAAPTVRTRITARSTSRTRVLLNRGSGRQPVDGTPSRTRPDTEPDVKIRFPWNLFLESPPASATTKDHDHIPSEGTSSSFRLY
jgi:hypothetical protein